MDGWTFMFWINLLIQNQKHFIDSRGENWAHIIPKYSNDEPQKFSDVMALAEILSKTMPKLTINIEQNVFSNNTWVYIFNIALK